MKLLFLCLTLILSPRHVSRVLDGDTGALFHVGVQAEERFRVLGVDAYELTGGTDSTKALARTGRDSTAAWLARGPFKFDACRRDSFGRYLVWITRGSDSLHVFLINAGLGVRP